MRCSGVALLFFIAQCLGGVSLHAQAAVVSVDSTALRSECNIRIKGAVLPGDLQKLKLAIQKVDRAFGGQLRDASLAELWSSRNPTLCLNSPGGNYAEALKVAEFLLRDEFRPTGASWLGVTTSVESGAECLSASALVFMAGKFVDRGGETTPSRILHVGGQLGFHAPYVDPTLLEDRPYSKEELGAAHAAATVAISAAIKLFNYRINEGPVTGPAKPWVKPSLFVEMLNRSAQEIFLIDTVFKAGRWGVDLAGFTLSVRLDSDAMRTACENFRAWEADQDGPSSGRVYEQVPFERVDAVDASPEAQIAAPPGGARFKAQYNKGEQECVVDPIAGNPGGEFSEDRNPAVGFNISLTPGSESGSGIFHPLWHAAPPETKIGAPAALMRKDGGMAPESAVRSALVTMERYPGTAFPYKGETTHTAANVEACERRCRDDASCLAFTYFKSSRQCRLMDHAGAHFPDRRADSGVKRQAVSK